MNLCFSTLGCAERTLEETFALCDRFGISRLEIRGIGGELDPRKIPEFSDGQIQKTAARFRAAGITPLILGTSCAFHRPENRESVLAEGSAALAVAKSLGAMGIRVFGDRFADHREQTTRNAVEGIARLCDAAKGTDVKILLEVHGDFHTVESLSPILRAFEDEPRFGLIWDIAHTHPAYGENWKGFYDAVAPFVRHVHIKDARGETLTLPGNGEIPILPIVRRLLADGYKGAFSLEWEKKWHPELPPIESALERFVSLMKSVG